MTPSALLERPTALPAPSGQGSAAHGTSARVGPVDASVARTSGAPAASLPTAATSPRGFALYVGFDEAKAAAAGVSLGTLVDALRRTISDIAPEAQTYATVALTPAGVVGRDVDLVRLALHEPAAVARTKQEQATDRAPSRSGVTVDISRKRVILDGETAALTFKEFELLQYLVLREGRTIDRSELVDSLWRGNTPDDAPGERTIDVHVRRLRSKLGRFEDIVRTVRGLGYRFDRHADVSIHYGHGTPSPDRF